jgi:hypothetical protein
MGIDTGGYSPQVASLDHLDLTVNNGNTSGVLIGNSGVQTAEFGTGVNHISFFNGRTGVGSSTPMALFSIAATSSGSQVYNNTLFAIGSSTASATTTLFTINNVGSTTIGLFGPCSGTNALQTSATGLIQCGSMVSDARLKQDVQPLGPALNLLMKLQPITYHFKEATGLGSQEETGFIAQDVQKIVPDAVERTNKISPLTPDGELDLKPMALISLEAKAIQEQQQEIEAIKGGTVVAERSVEENWQDLLIGILIVYVAYNEYDKRRRR